MMRLSLFLAGSALALSACTGPEIAAVRATEAQGGSFDAALTREYRQLALYEADRMYDWQDAGHYADKGLKAARGEAVAPDEIAARRLPESQAGGLTSARNRLMKALAAGAAEKRPADAARAQASFDCWMEQQEENHQADHIAACRQAFEASFNKLELALAPPAPTIVPAAIAVEPPALAPERFTLHFELDSAGLSPTAQSILAETLAAASNRTDARLTVTGHADRAGGEAHNVLLSLERANKVLDALVSGGVSADHIGVSGLGETTPAVTTNNGVAEPANRRVEIELQ